MILSPDLIGYVAAFFTTFSFAPQALLTLRTRDTRTLSLGMYSMFVVGVSLWFVYGALQGDGIIMLANGLTLLLSMPILGMKLFNRIWGNERAVLRELLSRSGEEEIPAVKEINPGRE